jgi:magnesium chelatase subunit D
VATEPVGDQAAEAAADAERVRRAGDLYQAAALLLIDSAGLGGVRLHGAPGPVRDAWLALLQALLPAGTPLRRLPAGIAEDRLLGGLDLTATLQSGRAVLQQGLLAQADGGLVVAAMAERMPAGTAASLAAALDARELRIERDGLTQVVPTRLGVVALDESQGDDTPLPAALADRLGLWLELDGLTHRDTMTADADMAAEVARAAAAVRQVTVPDALVEALCAATLALGVDSPRAAWQAVCCARAAAAWSGRLLADADDVALAARLVLGPRATRQPVATEPAEASEPDDASDASAQEPAPADPADKPPAPQPVTPPPPPPPPPSAETPDDHRPPPADDEPAAPDAAQPADARQLEDRLVAAALAGLPPGMLARLMEAGRSRSRSAAAGRAGADANSLRHGRPLGSRPGMPRGGARLHLIDTLRAAAPWQRLRQAHRAAQEDVGPPQDFLTPSGGGQGAGQPWGCSQDTKSLHPDLARSAWPAAATMGQSHGTTPEACASAAPAPAGEGRGEDGAPALRRIQVRAGDFRIRRHRQPRTTTTIFALDASGSSALHRLGEAKGAVESLLAECYVRRDEVAVIAFRGATAELVLPPTRALARARRGLAGLPGGGGTPLAQGIDAAAALAQQVRRRGATPVVVLLTDGRANVARDGQGGRERAREQALQAAQALRAQGGRVLVIDTSVRPEPAARALADAAGARYLVLPQADAAMLHRAVRAASAAA